MRFFFGVLSSLAALVFAVLAALSFWVLVTRPLSWQGRIEGVLAVAALPVCVYFLVSSSKYLFSDRNKVGWQKADIYAQLVCGLLAYVGSIPWVIYLVLVKDREPWPLLPVCIPIYCGMGWLFVKVFRNRLKSVKQGINPR